MTKATTWDTPADVPAEPDAVTLTVGASPPDPRLSGPQDGANSWASVQRFGART